MAFEEVKEKINAYLGFAIKANKIVYGIDNILKSKKIHIVIASKELSPNSVRKLNNKIKSTLIEDYDFKNLMVASQCKVFGITDENLSNVIHHNYQLLLEGKNGKKIIK